MDGSNNSGYREDNISADQQVESEERPEGLQFKFDVIGVYDSVYPAQLSHLASGDIEPASWFYSFTPIVPKDRLLLPSDDPNSINGYETYGYIEFVLTPEQIHAQRRWREPQRDHKSALYSISAAAIAHGIKMPSSNSIFSGLFGSIRSRSKPEKVNVCIWSSLNMDGQKRIWLDQTEHLDDSKFEFTWIISLGEGKTIADVSRNGNGNPTLLSLVTSVLNLRKNGRAIDSPYNSVVLGVEALEMDPEDGRQPASQIWDGDELALYR